MKRRVIALVVIALAFTACDPSSATDKERRRAAAQWCESCPVWCDTDLRLLPTDVFIRSYRVAAMQYGHKERNHGAAWQLLQRLWCILEASGAETRHAFLRLLDDPDIAVRYCAAVHALGHRLARDAPLRVLREIASGTSPLAVYASIRLQDWEAGIKVEL